MLNDQDRDLLKFASTAQRITHRQLFEVAILKRIEKDRKVFEWRVSRLAKSGLLKKQRPEFLNRAILYSITNTGILALENLGVHPLCLYAEADGVRVSHQVAHSLELNRVHIALMKSGLLLHWTPSQDIRVLYRFDNSTYAKIYDAVAEVVTDSGIYSIGIEYERSLKPAKKYEEILTKLSRKDGIDAVLYLCSSRPVFVSIRQVFGSFSKKAVLVTEQEAFVQDPVNATVEWCYRETTISSALARLPRRDGVPST
jgi:hypothetical protein